MNLRTKYALFWDFVYKNVELSNKSASSIIKYLLNLLKSF